METLSTIGIVMLIFVILPSLDVVKGAMLTNCMCFIPALFSMLSRHSDENRRALKTLLDFACLIAQFSSFIIWPLTTQGESKVAYLIPVTSFLVSFGWWENYTHKNSSFSLIRKLAKMKDKLHRCRYFTYIFISCWKVLLIFATMVTSIYLVDGSVAHIFTQFKTAFKQHKILIIRDRADLATLALTDNHVGIEGEWLELDSSPSTPIVVVIVQIVATWLCYVFSKFACKICIQGFSFAFSISLTIPVTISVLIASCGIYLEDNCHLTNLIPRYLFWSCPSDPFVTDFTFLNLHAIMWLVWLLSQTWITIHIWYVPRTWNFLKLVF